MSVYLSCRSCGHWIQWTQKVWVYAQYYILHIYIIIYIVTAYVTVSHIESYDLIISYNIIQVLSRVMQSWMFFISIWSVDLTVYIIYFSLVSATLLGVVRRGGSSSLLYPSNTGKVGCPPTLFFFTSCISTPWIFSFTGFSAMSDMDIYPRDPLQSWGFFYILMSPTFLEESPKWAANLLNIFCASWHLCSVQSLQGYPLWFPGFQVNYRSSGGASFWGLSIVPKLSLILGGSLTLLEGNFCSRERVPWSPIPAFYYRRLLTNKV